MENNLTTREILEEKLIEVSQKNEEKPLHGSALGFTDEVATQDENAPEIAPDENAENAEIEGEIKVPDEGESVLPELESLPMPEVLPDENALQAKASLSDEINALYAKKQEKLEKNGIKSSADWVEKLSSIEDMLEQSPEKVIAALSQAYGVNMGQNEAVAPVPAPTQIDIKLKQLDTTLRQMQDVLNEQQRLSTLAKIDTKMKTTDDKGNLKYPFYNQVRDEIQSMMSSGKVADEISAYNQAIWLNESVRNQLIQQQANELLQKKVVDANKAKKASFTPTGKGVLTSLEVNEKPKTTRQLLEEAVKLYTYA